MTTRPVVFEPAAPWALPERADLAEARRIMQTVMPPTPQIRWPLLEARMGLMGGLSKGGKPGALWLKHENHTPLGAFKVRGGLVYFDRLLRGAAPPPGVVSATRGNHGQSVGYAARRHGLPATIFVPHGNSREKNAAMRAQGADLVETGHDFQAAREAAQAFASARGWHMVPSFHIDLVAGVATYALELFEAVSTLDVVYVPIGLGSGACGVIAARDALGLSTEVVGVVSDGAPAYALSLALGRAVAHDVSTVLADGMACRLPEPAALAHLSRGLDRVVSVSDDEVAQAMRWLFEDTHQVAEGAGAAAVAAVWQDRARLAGRAVAAVLSGGNVDRSVYAGVLADKPHEP